MPDFFWRANSFRKRRQVLRFDDDNEFKYSDHHKRTFQQLQERIGGAHHPVLHVGLAYLTE